MEKPSEKLKGRAVSKSSAQKEGLFKTVRGEERRSGGCVRWGDADGVKDIE